MWTNESKNRVLADTAKYIKTVFEAEGTGHDWWHIYRVRKLALEIARHEGGDFFLIEMAALLHDLEDWKLNHTGHTGIRDWMEKSEIKPEIIEKIVQITKQVSFKGAGVQNKATSIEAQIVQDADRLDAIGAIGIARTFAYGGSRGRLIYHPEIEPEFHTDFNAYKNGEGSAINHFYEKLLLLKDRLNTQTARQLAEGRHRFMETFLERFFQEWDAKI